MYDILIIGAGPAGISAGIYAVSRGKKTLVLEQAQVGGIIGPLHRIAGTGNRRNLRCSYEGAGTGCGRGDRL